MARDWRFPVPFLLILLVLGGVPQPAMPATPPASGDWDITTDTVVDNVTATLKGNLTVHSGATLTVTNSNLSFDRSHFWATGFPLIVEEGAMLRMTGTNISPTGQATGMRLYIKGRAELDRCDFTYCTIEVTSAEQCDVTKCSLLDADIYAIESNISVRDSTFSSISGWRHVYAQDGNLTVSGCCFFRGTGIDIGPPPVQPSAGIRPRTAQINDNLFSNIGGTSIYMVSSPQGSGNHGPETIHVEVRTSMGLLVERNAFADLENGIAVYGPSPSPFDAVRVSNNSFNDSWWGAKLSGLANSSITNNTFTNVSVGLHCEAQVQDVISANSFRDCWSGLLARYGVNQDISENGFLNCTTGILIGTARNLTVACNRFSGCDVSIAHDMLPYPPFESDGKMKNNRISNGTRGANLTSFTGDFSGNEIENCAVGAEITDFSGIVSGNRISNCSSWGLVAQSRTTLGSDLLVSDNTLEDCGILVSDGRSRTVQVSGNTILGAPQAGIEVWGSANITQNRISGSATGVRISSDYFNWSESDVSDNTFQNITGICVHAIGTPIGTASVSANNSYPRDCGGRLLQDWWLWVNVTDGAGRPVPDASISIAQVAGGWGRRWTGNDLCVNVSDYLVDNAGNVAVFDPSIITAEKPATGIARETMNITENTRLNLALEPLPDLCIDLFLVQSGRLQIARTVMARLVIGVDRTYLVQRTQELSVNVLLKADGRVRDSAYVTIPAAAEFGPHEFWWLTEGGEHTLSVVLDPANSIAEYDEENNERSEEVMVNSPPIAVLNVSSISAREGDDIAFSAEGSSDDILVAQYDFDFGDGTITGWIGSGNASHFYSRAGSYNATVRVRDNEGAVCERAAVVPLAIAAYPPEVRLDADMTVIGRGGLVRFSAVVANTNLDIAGIVWDFGDGRSETGLETTTAHIYVRPGVFTARVTVRDGQGRRGDSSIDIVVQNKLPTASFSFSPGNCTIETELTFTPEANDPDGRVVEWLWEFGDGTTSTEVEPRHRFRQKGNFTVALRVQDDFGDWSAPAAEVVPVSNLAPRARATFAPSSVQAGGQVTFYASCSTDPDDPFSALRFCWSSDDGWQGFGLNPVRMFASPGTFVVRLFVSDPDGATDFTWVVVNVKSRPSTGAGPSGANIALSAAALLLALAGAACYLRRSGRLRSGR